MVKQNNGSHNVILGLAISTAIGASVLYYLKSVQNRPTPVLHKIGRTIVEVGEMIENCNIGSCSDAVHQIENRAPQTRDLVANVMSWASTGLNLWKILNKGR